MLVIAPMASVPAPLESMSTMGVMNFKRAGRLEGFLWDQNLQTEEKWIKKEVHDINSKQ
jgi:predicted lipid carrier protein YhbT